VIAKTFAAGLWSAACAGAGEHPNANETFAKCQARHIVVAAKLGYAFTTPSHGSPRARRAAIHAATIRDADTQRPGKLWLPDWQYCCRLSLAPISSP
jgi:hypothetical protein